MDTIAAISTANTPGAIGIIRISGAKSAEICSKVLFKHNNLLPLNEILSNPRKAIYCDFIDPQNYSRLDQIVLIYYSSPNSYTGEDLAELCLHGNPLLMHKALSILFRLGARPAQGGEFTRRAVLNGKMDLTTAESISRVITARSRFELELAQKNVFGEIHRLSSKIRSNLINLKAECEAEIDFSTEDLTYESLEQRKERIYSLHSMIQKLLSNSDRASSIIDHSKIVLFGSPNTGKSSLLNAILGKERAIISDIPGTTRDYLVESMNIDGFPVQLIDTAGIRETNDEIEKMGIERSEKQLESADVRLFVLDTSIPIDPEEFVLKNYSKLEHSIVVANKIDIQYPTWKSNLEILTDDKKLVVIEVSSKTGKGLEELIRMISQRLKSIENPGEYILLEERNRYHFEKIHQHLSEVIELMDANAPPEIYIKEIDFALVEVGFVNGKVDTEEVLGRIFSKFCVGK